MAGAAEARSFSFLQIAEQIVWMEPGQKDSNKFERIKTPEAYNALTGRRNYYEEKIYLNDPTRQILFVLIPYGTTFMIDDVIYYKLDEARRELEAEPKEPVKPREESEAETEWDVSSSDVSISSDEQHDNEAQEAFYIAQKKLKRLSEKMGRKATEKDLAQWRAARYRRRNRKAKRLQNDNPPFPERVQTSEPCPVSHRFHIV